MDELVQTPQLLANVWNKVIKGKIIFLDIQELDIVYISWSLKDFFILDCNKF